MLDQAVQQTTDFAASQNLITDTQAGSIKKTSAAAAKTAEDITPSQEYYIGRSVAATILSQYRAMNNDTLNDYLNTMGQTLALASEKPETFRGYRFMALDSDEINAFAAPGGFILVTRGLIRCCPNEDALAAVLAHEIAHVQYGHGKRAIQNGRLTNLFGVAATEAAKNLEDQQLAQLTQDFSGAVNDVVTQLVRNGYSQSCEFQADRGAVAILKKIGYDPEALRVMLQSMDKRLTPGDAGFAKTHPSPQDRIANIQPLLGTSHTLTSLPGRDKRFRSGTTGV
ncbi:TPA: peptidase M48 [Candidatus Sumerlaeota bacterium]|nr:peptidase M48 [Candidatus Sumerlaeota bacterium]